MLLRRGSSTGHSLQESSLQRLGRGEVEAGADFSTGAPDPISGARRRAMLDDDEFGGILAGIRQSPRARPAAPVQTAHHGARAGSPSHGSAARRSGTDGRPGGIADSVP